MRVVGLIDVDVERRVKGIKGTILAKKRNKLQDPKGVALMRASEILRHIMKAKAKIILGMKVMDSLGCFINKEGFINELDTILVTTSV